MKALGVTVPDFVPRLFDVGEPNAVSDGVVVEVLASSVNEFDRAAARASKITGVVPERVIREGDTAQEVLKLIEEDEDIAALILAACSEGDDPGPLVSSLARTAGTFPIPVAIVPGHLTDSDIDAMA